MTQLNGLCFKNTMHCIRIQIRLKIEVQKANAILCRPVNKP